MDDNNIQIIALRAFADNYIWLLHNGCDAFVVDPGDASPVISALTELNLNLSTILITHHHEDHIGGVTALIDKYAPQVFAPKYHLFDFPYLALSDGQHINLPQFDLSFEIMWLPGHTQDHIAYVNEETLFCGDVMFGAGCGRLFDGTHAQMLSSLNRLKRLIPSTKVFCTHEYTARNIAFALTIDTNNKALQQRAIVVNALRKKGLASLPSTIDLELETNPFLRCTQPDIMLKLKLENASELEVFTMIRQKRNLY